MLHRDHFCDILVKKVTAICLCQKSLLAIVKSFGLILLAEEISTYPNIDCHVVFSDNSNKDA